MRADSAGEKEMLGEKQLRRCKAGDPRRLGVPAGLGPASMGGEPGAAQPLGDSTQIRQSTGIIQGCSGSGTRGV